MGDGARLLGDRCWGIRVSGGLDFPGGDPGDASGVSPAQFSAKTPRRGMLGRWVGGFTFACFNLAPVCQALWRRHDLPVAFSDQSGGLENTGFGRGFVFSRIGRFELLGLRFGIRSPAVRRQGAWTDGPGQTGRSVTTGDLAGVVPFRETCPGGANRHPSMAPKSPNLRSRRTARGRLCRMGEAAGVPLSRRPR